MGQLAALCRDVQNAHNRSCPALRIQASWISQPSWPHFALLLLSFFLLFEQRFIFPLFLFVSWVISWRVSLIRALPLGPPPIFARLQPRASPQQPRQFVSLVCPDSKQARRPKTANGIPHICIWNSGPPIRLIWDCLWPWEFFYRSLGSKSGVG